MGRCDHDPRAPRLELVVAIAPNLPKLLGDALDGAAWVFYDPIRFPELTGHAIAGADTRIRKRRTERLEAITLVVRALVRRCDLRTLRVGDQREDGLCNGVTVESICEQTGLSRWRVSRAIAELEAAGYIRSSQAVEEYVDVETGAVKHRGFPAVRVLTPLLFTRLQIDPLKLREARKEGYRRWCARRARPASAVAIHGTRRALHQLAAATSPARPPALPARYYELELMLKARHPDWGIERLQAEARRLLPRR